MEQKNIIKDVVKFVIEADLNFWWKNILWHVKRVMEEQFQLETIDYNIVIEETSYGTKTLTIEKWSSDMSTLDIVYRTVDGFDTEWFDENPSLSDDEFELSHDEITRLLGIKKE